jgi:hypothetical protein
VKHCSISLATDSLLCELRFCLRYIEDFPMNGSVFPISGTFMRYLKSLKVKRKVVDNKHWLTETHDEDAERAYMKRQGEARRKLSRLRIIRALAEK